MKIILAVSLALLTAPLHAAAPPAVSTAAAPDSTTDHRPADAASTYSAENFETALKAEQKVIEADAKEGLSDINAAFDAQKKMEARQFKERFAFLENIRDERIAYEKSALAEWKTFAAKLRAAEPADRGAERIAYETTASESRSKFNDAASAKSKVFNDAQNRERDAFWAQHQKDGEMRARAHQQRAAQSSVPSSMP